MKKIKKDIFSVAKASTYKAKCYRNLNKPGVVWSVLNSSTGLVDQYANTVYLDSATFKVGTSGQLRVRLEKRKNVHAYVCGKVIANMPKDITWLKATYNPYNDDGFHVIGSNHILTSARYAMLCESGLYVSL